MSSECRVEKPDRSKGKNLADSLVDNDFDELKDLAGSKLSKTKGAVLGASESE